ncbi:hypothetical protein BSKO_11717 [Bryopsis sp. KO-2023]|nr:hypothetical protein BSKO_11717 [Bryopsis sp. KO-2023]
MKFAFASVLVAAVLVANCAALTLPDQLDKLVYFRDAMKARSAHWVSALESWVCPNTVTGECDPCGPGSIGLWHHMHCRGLTPGKDGDGTVDGYVTNIHVSDMRVDGPIPRELCLFEYLRELDLDGGRLSGPIPEFVSTCFPDLAEMDLSYNRLSGTLPGFIADVKTLQEIELRNNRLIGSIPEEIGSMPNLRELELDGNKLTGKIPASFKGLKDSLTAFLVAGNDLEGDLSPLSTSHLIRVSLQDNPKLCGMVPASVRYAVGYDPTGTRLGEPC